MVNAFKQPVRKLYVMFVKSLIPIFHSFNTILQPKEPLIHILHHSTLRMYCLLLSIFIRPEVISESDNKLSFDTEDPVLIVYLLEQWPSNIQGTVTSLEPLSIKNYWKKLDLFPSNVQSMWKQTSMPVLKNDVIKSLTFLRLKDTEQR